MFLKMLTREMAAVMAVQPLCRYGYSLKLEQIQATCRPAMSDMARL